MMNEILEVWIDLSNERKTIRMSYGEKLEEVERRTGISIDEIKRIVKTDEFLDKVYEAGSYIDKAKFADAIQRQHDLLDSRVDMVGLEASKEIINRQITERNAKIGEDKQSISDKLTDLLNDLK